MNDVNAQQLIQLVRVLTEEVTALRMEVHRLANKKG